MPQAETRQELTHFLRNVAEKVAIIKSGERADIINVEYNMFIAGAKIGDRTTRY